MGSPLQCGFAVAAVGLGSVGAFRLSHNQPIRSPETDPWFRASEVCMFDNPPYESYFWDPSCVNGGIGCMADDRHEECRFCGHREDAVPCPPLPPAEARAALLEDEENSLPCYGLIHESICGTSGRCYWDEHSNACNPRCEDTSNQNELLCINAGISACLWERKQCIHPHDRCEDSPADWRDTWGLSCEDYMDRDYCTPGAAWGEGWHSYWGSWGMYGTNGTSAAEACCACGGGIRQEMEILDEAAITAAKAVK